MHSLDDQTVIAIKAPPETRLEVPDPTKSIQIWLKSLKGPIEVFLCPEDSQENTTDPGNTSISSSEADSSYSEDSTSCDSFKGIAKCYIPWLRKF